MAEEASETSLCFLCLLSVKSGVTLNAVNTQRLLTARYAGGIHCCINI